MNVAILYSGGKDSNFALYEAQQKGWNVRYLLSVKPTRTDCFLFHYATVEYTPLLAQMAGLRHILTTCNIADPTQEAEIVKNIVIAEEKIDALILGGVGLQETQINSIRKALEPYHIEVFAMHAELTEEESLRSMLNKGFRIMITQFATDGLGEEWLGTELTLENFETFKKRSEKYGFNLLGEGGYYDTLVIGSPCFNGKELQINESYNEMESPLAGHLVIDDAEIITKRLEVKV